MSQNTSSITYHLERARNEEEPLASATIAALENYVTQVWSKIVAQPDSYILSREEFAVFNYFQTRFDGDPRAVAAKARYWNSQPRPVGSS